MSYETLTPYNYSQLLPPTKKLGAACRLCLLDHDDGFDFCVSYIDAVLEDPTSPSAWDYASCFALEATRLGFDAVLDEREGHLNIAVAMNYIGDAWMAAIEGGPDRLQDAAQLLARGLKYLDAGQLALDRPNMVPLPANGDWVEAQNNVIRFPRTGLKIARMDAAQFRVELQTATREIAGACKRCCCGDDDCFRSSAKLFQRLLANRRAAKADPTAMDIEIVQAGFRAYLDGRYTHWHLAVAIRYTGYAWEYAKRIDADNLDSAIKDLHLATDHLRQANSGLAMKQECGLG